MVHNLYRYAEDDEEEHQRRGGGGFIANGVGASVVKRLTSESVGGRSPYVSLGPEESSFAPTSAAPSTLDFASRADKLRSPFDSPGFVKGAASPGSDDAELSVEEMADSIFNQGQKKMNVGDASDIRRAKSIMIKAGKEKRAKTEKGRLANTVTDVAEQQKSVARTLSHHRGSLILQEESEVVSGGGGVESFEARYDRVIQEKVETVDMSGEYEETVVESEYEETTVVQSEYYEETTMDESAAEYDLRAESSADEREMFRRNAPELASLGDKISHFEKEGAPSVES
jgi:hypothetical protein